MNFYIIFLKTHDFFVCSGGHSRPFLGIQNQYSEVGNLTFYKISQFCFDQKLMIYNKNDSLIKKQKTLEKHLETSGKKSRNNPEKNLAKCFVIYSFNCMASVFYQFVASQFFLHVRCECVVGSRSLELLFNYFGWRFFSCGFLFQRSLIQRWRIPKFVFVPICSFSDRPDTVEGIN